MKTRTMITICWVVAFALILPLSLSAAQPGTTAFADFEIAHPNGCTVTTASVVVVNNPAYQPGDPSQDEPRVDFTYSVFGQPTSPGCDALWYYDLHGSAPLNAGEFSVHRSLRSATLDKTMQVYDEEGAVFFDVTLHVEWTAAGRPQANVRPAIATLSVSSPQLSPLYIVNPLPAEPTAGLARLR